MAHPRLDHALNKGFHYHEAINSNASFPLDKMIFHRKVTRCDRKKNATSVIKKKAHGPLEDTMTFILTDTKPTISEQYSRVKQRLLNPPVNPWIEVLSHLRH